MTILSKKINILDNTGEFVLNPLLINPVLSGATLTLTQYLELNDTYEITYQSRLYDVVGGVFINITQLNIF